MKRQVADTTRREGRVILVANTGGHLEQLTLLDQRLPYEGERLWVTSDTAQSRSLLAGRNVEFVRNVGSRDYGGLLANASTALRLIRRGEVQAVVSTGSGQALAYLPLAAAKGIETHYIESATRTEGPSFTGAILERMPRVHLHTQHARWADARWTYPGSVFDGFEIGDAVGATTHLERVVVSVGTSPKYGFRRLIERLVGIIPSDAEVLWQTGCTDVSGLGIDGREQVPQAELAEAIGESDLLVAHAGTGIALTAFTLGRSPLLVPREVAHGEHVDDHQLLTARLLEATGLGVVRKLDDLAFDDCLLAASRRVDFRADHCAELNLAS